MKLNKDDNIEKNNDNDENKELIDNNSEITIIKSDMSSITQFEEEDNLDDFSANNIKIVKFEDSKSNKKDLDNVNAVIEKIGYTSVHIKIIVLSFIVYFFEGIHLSLYGFAILPIKSYFKASEMEVQISTSSIFLTTGIGSLSIPLFTSFLGRIKTIQFSIISVTCFYFMSIFSPNLYFYGACRAMSSFFWGILSPLTFNILLEYLPIKGRNILLLLCRGIFTIGQVLICLMIKIFTPSLNGSGFFYIMIITTVMTYIILFLYFTIFDDSPRNMVIENNFDGLKSKLTEIIVASKLANEELEIKSAEDFSENFILSVINCNTEKKNDKDNKDSETSSSFFGRFEVLFNSANLKNTFLVLFIGMTTFFIYFGSIIIFTPTLKAINKNNLSSRLNMDMDMNILHSDIDSLPFKVHDNMINLQKYEVMMSRVKDIIKNENLIRDILKTKNNSINKNEIEKSKSIIDTALKSCLIRFSIVTIISMISEMKAIGMKFLILTNLILLVTFSTLIVLDFSSFSMWYIFYISTCSIALNFFLNISQLLFKTKVRDIAISFSSFFNRISGFLSQFIFLYLFEKGIMIDYYITIVCCILILIASLFLRDPSKDALDS